MSMTYYAVTDDPNELAHFGILGMKWGRRRTPEQLGHPRHSGSGRNRPRSAAYKRAQSKLSKTMQNGIAKVKANWKEYNSPKAKEERFMKKAMQQARTGTLKYGKLTDDQVRRVTDRLALERNARQLGNTENPSYAKRIKSAVGEGIVRGLGAGTSAYIEERFRGRGRSTADIKAQKRKEKYEAKQSTIRRKVNKEIDEQYYKDMAESGGRAEGKIKTLARMGANTIVTGAKTFDRAAGSILGYNDESAIKDEVKKGLAQNKNLSKSMFATSRARVTAQKRIADKEEERAKRLRDIQDEQYYRQVGILSAKEKYGVSDSGKLPKSNPTQTTTISKPVTQPTPKKPNKTPSRRAPIGKRHPTDRWTRTHRGRS